MNNTTEFIAEVSSNHNKDIDRCKKFISIAKTIGCSGVKFQSFRIKVNNELENIVQSIIDAIHLLKPKGRLAVISFHSLEDRLVKNIFKDFARGGDSIIESMGYNFPQECKKIVKILTKKPISPNWEEIKKNKRSRSAKLRVIEKL